MSPTTPATSSPAPSSPVPSSLVPSLAVSVDPPRLTSAAWPVLDVVAALSAATPGLRLAWAAAAQALAGQRTGQALAACQSSTLAAVGSCAAAAERLAWAFQRAAESYRDLDHQATVTEGASQ